MVKLIYKGSGDFRDNKKQVNTKCRIIHNIYEIEFIRSQSFYEYHAGIKLYEEENKIYLKTQTKNDFQEEEITLKDLENMRDNIDRYLKQRKEKKVVKNG